jgi:heme-degrading monooxygenase HmoA
MIATTPAPPYYAVIFTSVRTEGDNGYAEMAAKMEMLAREQPGYLGMEHAGEGQGITVSYWSSLEAIAGWHDNIHHRVAQTLGRRKWYQQFKVRICFVERDYAL